MNTMEKEPQTVAEGIVEELKRARELLDMYKEIGQVGTFGVITINQEIDRTEAALASGDVIKILQAYESLKGLE